LIAIMSISWQMTEGLGFPQFNALATGICTAIGISLMLMLTEALGNYGVALARLTGFSMIFFSIFVVEKLFFKKIQVRFWVGLIGNLGLAALSAVIIEYSITAWLPINWPALLLSVFLGGSTYCFILWLLDFVTADEKLLLRRVFSR